MFIYYCNSEYGGMGILSIIVILNMVGWERLSTIPLNMVGFERLSIIVILNRWDGNVYLLL